MDLTSEDSCTSTHHPSFNCERRTSRLPSLLRMRELDSKNYVMTVQVNKLSPACLLFCLVDFRGAPASHELVARTSVVERDSEMQPEVWKKGADFVVSRPPVLLIPRACNSVYILCRTSHVLLDRQRQFKLKFKMISARCRI